MEFKFTVTKLIDNQSEGKVWCRLLEYRGNFGWELRAYSDFRSTTYYFQNSSFVNRYRPSEHRRPAAQPWSRTHATSPPPSFPALVVVLNLLKPLRCSFFPISHCVPLNRGVWRGGADVQGLNSIGYWKLCWIFLLSFAGCPTLLGVNSIALLKSQQTFQQSFYSSVEHPVHKKPGLKKFLLFVPKTFDSCFH